MPRYSDKELIELLKANPDAYVMEPRFSRGQMVEVSVVPAKRVNEYPGAKDARSGHSRVVSVPAPGVNIYVFDDALADRTMKQSEHALQVAIILECNHRAHEDARWGMIFAIPNGGQRSKAVAGKLKAEGVRAGVPDLFIPVARHGYHGAFIELKVGRNKPTENQNLWAGLLKDQGYKVSVFWNNAKEVIDWIEWYLNG